MTHLFATRGGPARHARLPIGRPGRIFSGRRWLALIGLTLLASSAGAAGFKDRLAEVVVPGVLNEASVFGAETSPYAVPAFQDRGLNNRGLFRRNGATPTFIKVQSFDTDASAANAALAHAEVIAETIGLLLGEEVGGPRVLRTGLFEAAGWLNMFYEMEFLYPDVATFTYKGTLNGLYPPLAAFDMKYRFRELTTLITRALDRSIHILDVDFIVSPLGVRWIDPVAWTVKRPLDKHSVRRIVDVLLWAEKLQRGQGMLMYLRLRRHVERSPAFDANGRAQVLEGLLDFEVALMQRSCGARLDHSADHE